MNESTITRTIFFNIPPSKLIIHPLQKKDYLAKETIFLVIENKGRADTEYIYSISLYYKDIKGRKLDGNSNGIEEGSPDDNYYKDCNIPKDSGEEFSWIEKERGGIVRESNISPINIKEKEQRDYPIELGSITSPGTYYLESTLLNHYHQRIGYKLEPILISTSTLSLFLDVDEKPYKPNEPIPIKCIVANRGDVPENNLLVSLYKDNFLISTRTINLGTNSSYYFYETITSSSSFSLKLMAKDVSEVREIRVERTKIEVKIELGGIMDKRRADILLYNKGLREANLFYCLNLEEKEIGSASITLKETERETLTFTFEITRNSNLYFILSGDFNETYTTFVQKESGEIEGELYQGRISTQTYTIYTIFRNKGPFEEMVNFSLEVNGNKEIGE
ncbi:MAG: hypothetical protein AB1595_06040 [bacterium]